MKIYIDNEFKCHCLPNSGLTEIETDAFDGKCKYFIETFRFVPSGRTWEREDGTVFKGELIAPWKDIRTALVVQKQYEEDQETSLNDLANLIEEVYESDMERINE